MAWLKSMMSRIGVSLRELSLSQRMVILLGGLLVGGSLLWLVQWAASPEMVPLLRMDLGPDDIARVRSGLEQMNEPFKESGSQILVRASANKEALLARLLQDEKLPESTITGFEALVKENNPWLWQEENNRRWTVALSNELEAVLRKFSGVRSADVFLDLNSRRRSMLGGSAESRASVTLKMKGGEPLTRKLAMGVARLISGAVRGVSLRHVSVVDGNTGASALEWEDDHPGSGSALGKQKAEHEKRIAAKIRSQLGIPKARVSVQVELETTSKTTQSNTPVDGAIVKEETDESERNRGSAAAQPGAQINTGVAVNGPGMQSTETRKTETIEYQTGQTITSEQTPAGDIKEISAAINVSYSYLESVFRRKKPDVENPTTDDVTSVFDGEKSRIINQVTKLVKPAEADQVAVDWYYDSVDLEMGIGSEGGDGATTLDSAMELAKRYGPQSALGMLALVSFALMLNMSKKIDAADSIGLEIGLPVEHIEAAKQAARDVADEAAKGGPPKRPKEIVTASVESTSAAGGLLVGKEVDESTVQMQSMLEQVGKFVAEDPEVVAGLFERWVRDDK